MRLIASKSRAYQSGQCDPRDGKAALKYNPRSFFPRCSAVGLVSAVAFFGVAVAPLLMKLESTHPIVPLGIMGVFSILAGILSRGLLPETKGKMTAETLDDSCDPGLHFDTSGSPKVHRRLQNAAEMEECGLLSPDGGSSEELFAHSEENSLDTSSLEVCLSLSNCLVV